MSIQNNSENAQFTWINFYMDLADELLKYKDRRRELLEKLNSLDSKWVTYLRDKETGKWKFPDIDPFSVFAIFNRGIKNETRFIIAQRFKDIFQLKSEVPSDLWGIPVAFNSNSIFFAKENVKTDISPLWDLFEYAINYPGDDTFISKFQNVLALKGIGWVNITVALFWIRPEKFITLDQHTREFLISKGIQVMKKNDFSGRSYLDLIERVKKSSLYSKKTSFPAISKKAWLSKHPQNEEDRGIVENRESDPIISAAYNLLQLKKNVILQGAPGTGKTYSTAAIALEILGVEYSDTDEMMERYSELCEQGRIFFTTFHQSMDYEDFVEGLKPVVTDEGIRYDVEKGIFKKVCENASSLFNEKRTKEIDFTNTRIFKMSLGQKNKDDVEVFDYCKENNVIALGWGGDKDFSNCQTRKDFQKSDNTWGAKAMEIFKCWMRVGDIVLVSDGNTAVKAIARIIGDYEFHDDAPIDMCQFRKVEWLYLGDSIPLSKFYDSRFTPQSIYAFYSPGFEGTSKYNGSIKTDMINDIITAKVNTEKPLPHVLIIDEINRGNVSKIFGELVTLLEKDKRAGDKHSITVKLPYSKDDFSVPSNIYIIGTMNTTDRSTGTLDYAIRRRFAFVTLEAKPDIIPEGKARDLFNDIKKFIENEKNHPKDLEVKDLMVGHYYFMPDPDKEVQLQPEEQLKLKIEYEVIPLLKEYLNDGLLTCSQKELDKRIASWKELKVYNSSETQAPATSEQEGNDEDQE